MTERQCILGIDPGSRLTGFGVLDCASGCATYVASGSVRTAEGAFPERLRLIFHSIKQIVEEYQPDIVAIESVFMHKNAASALKLGQARSAAICATFGFELEIHEYAPREIKQAIVGTGAASKEQIQHMVRSLLELDSNPAPDAADALATALCYAHRRRLHSKISGSAAIAGRR